MSSSTCLSWSVYHICHRVSSFFFFNDTATTEIYTLSLHDALPISPWASPSSSCVRWSRLRPGAPSSRPCPRRWVRSEEHTSELQSRLHLVCRLLLEKKKKRPVYHPTANKLRKLDVKIGGGRKPHRQ